MVKQVTMFQDSHGNMHYTEEDAKKADKRHAIYGVVAKAVKYNCSSASDIADLILNNYDSIKKAIDA